MRAKSATPRAAIRRGSLDELIEFYPNVFGGEQVTLGDGFGGVQGEYFDLQFTADVPRMLGADAP